MYSIFVDGVCIYDDTTVLKELKLINPRFIRQDNMAGSLSFIMAQTNPGYSLIEPFKNEVQIKKNGNVIWTGRPITESKNFYNQKSITCEGCYGYLNDSIQPQHNYNSTSVRAFLTGLINNHNSQSTRQFSVRNVTDDGSSHNFTTDYDNTLECINRQLIEDIGGHISVEKIGNIYYIDYIYNLTYTSSQIIRFGKNLLDFTQDLDRTSIATVVIPFGAVIDYDDTTGFERRVDITSVNGGRNYLESSEAISEYGRIVKVETWDYVEDPARLKIIGERYLQAIQFEPVRLSINAVDLTNFGVDTEEFKMLDLVRVISDPHGLNKYFPITKIDMPLNDLGRTTYTMGAYSDTTLSSNNKTVQNYIYDVTKEYSNKISSAYIMASDASDKADRAIVTDVLHYLATPLSSGVTTQTPGWTTTPQSMTSTNKYLWTYHTYTYADEHTSDTTPVITGVYGEDGDPGQQGPAGPAGQDGQDGTSVTVSSIEYASDASGTTAPSSGWQYSIPTVPQGYYLWTKTTYSDNTIAYTVSRQGANGQQGPAGPAGQDGQDGQDGTDGTDGISIIEVTSLYYASNSSTTPSAPSSEVTTTSSNVYNTWTKGIPALTSTYDKLYTCDQVKYSDNTFTWTTPVLDRAMTTAVSEILQMADTIVLKVKDNGQVVTVALGTAAGQGSDIRLSGQNITLDGNVNITNGFTLNAGVIQSANYDSGVSGTRIDLTTGVIDAVDVSIKGSITAYNGIKLYSTYNQSTWDFAKFDWESGDTWEFTINAPRYGGSGGNDCLISYTAQSDEAIFYGKATKAGRSDYLQSVQTNGTAYNNAYLLRSRYNKWNDGRFGLEIVNNTSETGEYAVRVAYATSAVNIELEPSNYSIANINAKWGPGLHLNWYSVANALSNQPAQHGFLLSAKVGKGTVDMHQIYMVQANGDLYHRGGNASSNWNNIAFRRILDSANYTSVITSTLNLAAGQFYKVGNHSAYCDLGTNSAVLCADNGTFIRKYSNTNTAMSITASAFMNASSKLVKENIEPLSEEYAKKLLQLKTKSFDYIEKVGGEKDCVGMIAEEVLEIMPNLVTIPENYNEAETKQKIEAEEFAQTLSLDYAKFVPPLIKLVQMQQKEIEDLKNMVQNLIAK